MILLKATTETLELSTSATAGIDYSVSYADITTTAFTPSTSEGKITTITTTPIVAAPAASTQRQIKLITLRNIDGSASNNVIVKKDISGTEYFLTPTITLAAGEVLQYTDGQGWIVYGATGAPKSDQTAAGSTTQIQFNNSGALSGDADFTWDNTTNNLGLSGTDTTIAMKGITNEPASPSSGNLTVYSKAVVGKMQLKIKGPSGLDTPLQAAFWQNNTVWWTPGAAAGVYTGTAGSNLGTAAAVLPTTTNIYTAMRRSTFASVVTTPSQQVGIRTEAMFFRGNAAGLMPTC